MQQDIATPTKKLQFKDNTETYGTHGVGYSHAYKEAAETKLHYALRNVMNTD